MWDELAAAAWIDPSLITKRETRYMSVDLDRGAGYGNTLTWTATIEDPDYLLEPWTTTPRVALLRPNAMLPESQPCSERDLAHVVTKEHH